MARPRSEAPDIPGFRHLRWLGGGGFADVFLYEQQRPFRNVAVKVLRTSALDEEAQRRFDAEADLMASVSAHPYIVAVFEADVAPDGRPYLVMEYYPPPHFGDRAKPKGMGVAEALRIGVQISSAVEVAHQAGILHRDIKPANILASEYSRPGLTDFGIAGTRIEGALGESFGVTVPYAAPEVLEETSPGDEASDVYSLAAATYSLLCGRSPFELSGGDNSTTKLLERVLRSSVPPTGRVDVPPTLEHLLTHAMAKRPQDRPQSAVAFARALQDVERDLGFAPTAIEVRVDHAAPPVAPPLDEDPPEEGTRIGRIQVVHAAARVEQPSAVAAPVQLPAAAPTLSRRAPVADTIDRPRPAAPVAAPDRPVTPPAAPGQPAAAADRSRDWLFAVGSGALVLVALIGFVLLGSGNGGADGDRASTTTAPPATAVAFTGAPPVPADVTITATEAGASVAWDVSSAAEGDVYRVQRVDPPYDAERHVEVPAPPYEITGLAAGERPCVEVSVVRGDRLSEASPPRCLP